MSIKALPSTTVRIIGSAQVLTDPASVVKELVDNALDARATSVFVEIAANGLDVIQVRDNGHGIAPDDRSMICKRYCTSKIKEYSDLQRIGGKWLGFRGEALAAAAELSSSILITTKVEGEAVAVAMTINSLGEIEKQDRASHPVGTTVRVNDVFRFLPVRKQSALKAVAKTLGKIKHMLQEYALARPTTRFSLKVLKAKNDKANWMYVPNPNAGIQLVEDAAFKVVGKDCATQCDWVVLEHDGFEIQAFLPRPDAIAAKISNVGAFVFVDSRPVRTIRGTLKQVSTLYKERLRRSHASLESVKDPFIYLNILCPEDSYDPNVEPAKDDVIFEDNTKVLEAVEKMLDQVYPRSDLAANDDAQAGAKDTIENSRSGANDTLENPMEAHDERVDRDHLSSRTNMYKRNDNDADLDILYDVEQTDENARVEDDENASDLCDISISNPWVMAKMNSSSRPQRNSSWRNGQMITPLGERNRSDANSTSATEAVFPSHPPWSLPTPAATSSPLRGGRTRSPASTIPHEHDAAQYSAPSIDIIEDEPDASHICLPRQGWTALNDFVPAGQLPLGTPYLPSSSNIDTFGSSSPIRSRQAARHQQHAHNGRGSDRPFVSPAKNDTQVWFANAAASTAGAETSRINKRKRVYPDIDLQQVIDAAQEAGQSVSGRRVRRRTVAGSDDDGGIIDLDAENTHTAQATLDNFFTSSRVSEDNENATPEPCVRTFRGVPPDPLNSPPILFDPPTPRRSGVHASSPKTMPQVAEDVTGEESRARTSLSPQRTRSNRSCRATSRALSRSALLPLERVPPGSETHNLVTSVELSIRVLEASLRRFLGSDECHGLRNGGLGRTGARGWEAMADSGAAGEEMDEAEADGGDGEYARTFGGSAFSEPAVVEEDVEYWNARLDALLRDMNGGSLQDDV